MRLLLLILFLSGCEKDTYDNYADQSRIICHDQIFRDCLRKHKEAGRIVLDADYRIIESGKHRMWEADCIIKKYNCRDDIYYKYHPHIPRHKQSRFSDAGWTKETLFNPEVKEPPGLKKQKKEDRKRFWGN